MARPALRLTPTATAVIFVEVQNGIVGPDSSIPDLARAAAPRLSTMGRLAKGARAAGGRVFHLIFVPALETRAANRKPPLMAHTTAAMADWTADHPAVQPVAEIGVEPEDVVLPRHSGMSPTANTELFPMLRNAGFTAVVLAGVSLNVAIPLVAAQAGDEGFDVIVPRDAVAGTPAEHGESMLRHTIPVLARVVTTEEVLAAFADE